DGACEGRGAWGRRKGRKLRALDERRWSIRRLHLRRVEPGEGRRQQGAGRVPVRRSDAGDRARQQGADGKPGTGASRYAVVSGDGQVVVFQSVAPDLLCIRHCPESDRDINLAWDVLRRQRGPGAVVRASGDRTAGWMEGSRRPAVDAAGRVLIFSPTHPSDDRDIEPNDDLFVQVRATPRTTSR